MFDWLKKLGGGRSWKNRAGLEPEALALLAEDLGSLEKVDSDLAQDALVYALDGEEHQGLLARLAVSQEAAVALGFAGMVLGARPQENTARARFFARVRCGKPEFFIRLGRIYEAAVLARAHHLLHRSRSNGTQTALGAFEDARLNWLELLLMEATELALCGRPRTCRACPALNAEMVESMLEAEGHAPDLLVRTAFQPQLPWVNSPSLECVFASMPGIAESAVRHKAVVLEALHHADGKQRIYAAGMMKRCRVPAEPFAARLVELALSPSKQARPHAEDLLSGAKAAARPLIEQKLIEGSTDERVLSASLLWAWEGEAAREFLQSRLVAEKSKKVVRALEDALKAATPAPAAAAAAALQLPPLAPIPPLAPLGAETQRAWEACFQKVNAGLAKIIAGWPPAACHPAPVLLSADEIGRAFFAMQTEGKTEPVLASLARSAWVVDVVTPIKQFCPRPELELIHMVRLAVILSDPRRAETRAHWLRNLLPAFRRAHPEAGLRELGAAFTAAGLEPRLIGLDLLQSYDAVPPPFGMPHWAVWPYWAENLDLLEEAFTTAMRGSMDYYILRHSRRNAFHALAAFPHPPERLQPLLWKLALGPKNERPSAQRCLEGLPDKTGRLAASLDASDPETRLAAAEWMGRLGDASATSPLLAALRRETNEYAKAAMVTALELLHAPVEQFLNREALLKEAEKGAAKAAPAGLMWFPFDRLPVVRWSDNETPVEPVIVKWWLIQGFKLKNAEPGPLLRKYCARIKASERAVLGRFVLESWLAEDTAPITRAEAEKRALQLAQEHVQMCQSPYWPSNSPVKTLDEFYAGFLPGFLVQPKSSAASSKGILSLAGACAGAESVPLASRYLKKWYGLRGAQCRALLQMLAWVEHKTATQLLLSVGSRFRTKSIQEEAAKQAQALAERKGWTVAELADRTIPAAGLDEEGLLTLDYGPRQFTARLNEDLEFVLAGPDGKPLKSLPDPRKDDDEAKAAEAKKTFAAARKELKSAAAMQRDRFYEAMCTQRTWPFEDWSVYLNGHPIARHHCQRLVWAVVQDGKAGALFRPLPDGSLTDANDDPVTVKPGEQVRLAHECQVTPEQSQAWRQHLKDYEVEPLVEQFGRPAFDLTEERGQADEIGEFRGHVLEAFKLRGRAVKLGYTRGQPQDGGWFLDYRKRFPTLGIDAVIEFTGNCLPEENRTVALTALHFERAATEGEPAADGAKLPLGQLPPVLLAECWNNLRQLAAQGPGFDPEWEKNTG